MYQREKVIDWKEIQWPKPATRNSIRDYTGFVRSKSYSEQRPKFYEIPAKKTQELIKTQRVKLSPPKEEANSLKTPSMFIRTKDGKRK